MGLFDMFKRNPQPDAGLMAKAEALGYTGTQQEEGGFKWVGPDGREYAGAVDNKTVSIRFLQPKPYKVLFSMKPAGHFVNDPNPEGYRELIDSLHSARSMADKQNAVLTFLVKRG